MYSNAQTAGPATSQSNDQNPSTTGSPQASGEGVQGSQQQTPAQQEPVGNTGETQGGVTEQSPTVFGAAQRQHSSIEIGQFVPVGWSYLLAVEPMETYDSNVLLSRTNAKSDQTTSVSLRGTLRRTTARLQFDATYVPAYSYYQHNSSLNSFDSSYNQHLQYALSARNSITWNLGAAYYPGNGNLSFLAAGLGAPSLVGSGLQAFGSGVKITTGDTELIFTHRVSERTRISVGASGTAFRYKLRGNALLAGTSPHTLNNNSIGGTVNWEHDLSRTRTLGISVNETRLAFSRTQESYLAIQARIAQQLPHHFMLSAGTGPALNHSSGKTISDWNASLGLQHVSRSSTLDATISRRLQLGFLPSTSSFWSAQARYSRQWASGLNIGALLGVSDARSSQRAYLARNIFVSLNAGYRITSQLNAMAQYGLASAHTGNASRVQTQLEGSTFYALDYQRTRIAVGLVYRFGQEPQ